LTSAKSICCGTNHTAALTRDGKVVSWGKFGQRSVPTELENVIALDAGSGFSAALSNEGAIVCWGQPQQSESTFPIDLNCVAIRCCADNGIALTTAGTIFCWGSNEFGQCNSPDHISVLGMVVLM
jgi:hypothetical protein